MSKKVLAIKTRPGPSIEDKNDLSRDFVVCGSGPFDWTPFAKETRQADLKFWRGAVSERFREYVRFVLCNPDGTGVEEL